MYLCVWLCADYDSVLWYNIIMMPDVPVCVAVCRLRQLTVVQEDVPVDLRHREDDWRPASANGRRDAGAGGEADEHPRGPESAPLPQRQRRHPHDPSRLPLGILRLSRAGFGSLVGFVS